METTKWRTYVTVKSVLSEPKCIKIILNVLKCTDARYWGIAYHVTLGECSTYTGKCTESESRDVISRYVL